MAVPFYVPEEDEQRENSTSSSQPQSTTTSATQTPLQSPVSGEHLVQAFCEALYFYSNSIAGTPGFPSPPPSPSCNGGAYYGNVFFSRTNPVPQPPAPATPSGPQRYQNQQEQQGWTSTPRRRNINMTRRYRLNSTGTEEEDIDEDRLYDDFEATPVLSTHVTTGMDDSGFEEIHHHHHHHIGFMDADREFLPEFSGQIPSKKKQNKSYTKRPSMTTTTTSATLLSSQHLRQSIVEDEDSVDETESKPKIKDQKFAWPTVVTAVVIAVGCGFLVTR